MTRIPPRRVLALAAPALVVLAAEPLYVLVDTAVVGHLGALPLAGLALGGVLFTQVAAQLTFLSYGTTARAARLFGAGRRDEAVGEGVQATWLASAVGVVVLLLGQVLARPAMALLVGPGAVADAAVSWLRIAVLGAPFVLITLAGNGWMRGVQDTRRPLVYVVAGNGLSAVLCPLLVHAAGLGLEGSAIANVVAQTVTAALFLNALRSEGVALRPDWRLMKAQLGIGRDLVLRSLAFQACFLSAAAVVARTSVGAVGAHQVVYQLWTFLALVLDSLAIAAQSIVGASLGAGRREEARRFAWQVTGYGLVFGVVLGVVFAGLAGVLPRVFTTDQAVLGEIPHAWWFFVLLQPVAGVVFALDGVLLGAGDARYLRTTTLLAAGVAFLPLIWASYAFDWGLAGVWTGLSAFMVARLVGLVTRTRSEHWSTVGATTSPPASG
ncbi:MATE family efflux transporter [Saccharothrix violaceirubra]|uniref:Putative MATE family efflux protein n=1 Tax=Saccharothrix violaceirubra TaxID=413306 RepID=A0A7W7WU92_9PSEU|nr:MATE family efflux transporter [Saccharothrix violaceirubra]MBB4964040.1 putative MATE family efflux protein [Saccharothrix violaceirubra]